MSSYKFPKPCLDCGTLTQGDRLCVSCIDKRNQRPEALARARRRAIHKRMMYGAGYKARRDAVIASSTHCALCGLPFKLGDLVEGDHISPNPQSELQAVHRLCNQRKSNK